MQITAGSPDAGAMPGHRFVVLDSLRGVFATMIVLLHTGMQSHLFYSPITRNAAVFVDFFFVLSGFVIAYAYGAGKITNLRTLAAFMVRRVGRLWPLHAAVLLTFVAMLALRIAVGQAGLVQTDAAETAPERLRFAAEMLLFVHIFRNETVYWMNFPAWSIAAEFWAYASFGAVCLLGRRAIWAAIALALLASTVWIFTIDLGFGAFFGYGLFKGIGNFFIGTLTLLLWRRISVAPGPVLAGVMEAAVVGVVLVHLFNPDELVLAAAMPLVFAAAILIFAAERGPISRALLTRPFQVLGQRSYSIYMVHALVLAVLIIAVTVAEKLLQRSLTSANRSNPKGAELMDFGAPLLNDLATLGVVLVVVSLAGLTYRHIEIPGQRVAKRWAARIAGR